jgi:ribosome assembly protein 4
MIVSGSADSTLKVWDLKTNKLKLDLPGHADEVYSVDWSPDGERVASGAKDKVVKMYVRSHTLPTQTCAGFVLSLYRSERH